MLQLQKGKFMYSTVLEISYNVYCNVTTYLGKFLNYKFELNKKRHFKQLIHIDCSPVYYFRSLICQSFILNYLNKRFFVTT